MVSVSSSCEKPETASINRSGRLGCANLPKKSNFTGFGGRFAGCFVGFGVRLVSVIVLPGGMFSLSLHFLASAWETLMIRSVRFESSLSARVYIPDSLPPL